jgi:hypothetical protein
MSRPQKISLAILTLVGSVVIILAAYLRFAKGYGWAAYRLWRSNILARVQGNRNEYYVTTQLMSTIDAVFKEAGLNEAVQSYHAWCHTKEAEDDQVYYGEVPLTTVI